jgi:hypothetical protein
VLLQVTEVISTDASFAVFFLLAVASTAVGRKLPFNAAVESTDRSSQPVSSVVQLIAPG